MVRFERALVSSYRPSALHSNVSSTFTLCRDIVAFVPQHATFPHPTSSLSKFTHVPLWSGGLGYEERRCWAKIIVRAIVSKISNLRGPDAPTSQTDDMQSQYRALHYSASCGKKNRVKIKRVIHASFFEHADLWNLFLVHFSSISWALIRL